MKRGNILGFQNNTKLADEHKISVFHFGRSGSTLDFLNFDNQGILADIKTINH